MKTDIADVALRQAVADLTILEQADHSDETVFYHFVVAAMHRLTALIREAELSGMPRAQIQEIICPAYEIHGRSPFIHRLQTWPRGYPGDFETIEYLCAAKMPPPPKTMPWFIEKYILHGSYAQQHRNKLAWQTERILETCLRQQEVKILSIACGGSLDLRAAQRFLTNERITVLLNDLDSDAIAFSLEHLTRHAFDVHAVAGNVFLSIGRLKEGAPFDLILVGGLFDYLTDQQIVWLLPKLFGFLELNGRLCFTNIAPDNLDRVWVEHLGNWHLKERYEADIRRLVLESKLGDQCHLQISRDQTGLANLVELTLMNTELNH